MSFLIKKKHMDAVFIKYINGGEKMLEKLIAKAIITNFSLSENEVEKSRRQF